MTSYAPVEFLNYRITLLLMPQMVEVEDRMRKRTRSYALELCQDAATREPLKRWKPEHQWAGAALRMHLDLVHGDRTTLVS